MRMDKLGLIPKAKQTDLLIGITSIVPTDISKHYLLGDFDKMKEETYDDFAGRMLDNVKCLFEREKDFEVVFMVKSSDMGMHLASFDVELPLWRYVDILEFMGSDDNFIKWIRKVHYGVLRISRRSKHFQVPELYGICKRKGVKIKRMWIRDFYFKLLFMENQNFDIKRVRVYECK